MRNLRLLTSFSVTNNDLRNSDGFCVDPETDDVYFIIGSRLFRLKTENSEVEFLIDISVEGSDNNIGDFSIICLSFISELQAVCLVIENGDIVLFDINSEQLETIGSVESGILAADWSLDGDILAVVTGHESVILMTREFQPIIETPLFSEDFGEGKPVTVGWGKKETQFHGSEGKSAAVKQETSTEKKFEWDDGKPKITWRGDGQLFAINALSSATGCRRIYIFSRDGLLQYTSEVIKGLEGLVSWRPNGQVIATVQRLPNKYQIVFVEKNGLTHGEMVLPFSDQNIVVRGINWNSDSTLLSIWIDDLDRNSGFNSRVQIWTINNYHWYLKQSLILPNGKHFSNASWHPEKNLTFLSTTTDGDFLNHSWTWITDKSEDLSCHDDAVVAVIDGGEVLVTPFARVVVPPPYSAYKLTLPSPVQQILFPRHHSVNKMAVLTCENNIRVYSKDKSKSESVDNSGFKSRVDCHIEDLSVNLKSSTDFPLTYHHWTWISQNIFIAVKSTHLNSSLIQFSIDESSDNLIIKCEKQINGVVQGIISSCDLNIAIIQLKSGELLRYVVDVNEIKPWCSFPRFCSNLSTCFINDKEVVFGLNERFRLYCMDKELPVNCTSFALHDEFLLITATDHSLHCIPLTSDLYEKSNQFDANISRSIERGSRIVTCVKDGTQVILQMPRGNLEAIHPRVLTLNIVYKHLNDLKFGQAFELMRKHRINMNLLFDYNPKKFLDNVEKFVSQINNVNWINIFLTDLQEENISRELYNTNDNKFENKLNTVHSTVRKTLTETDSNKFLLSILTTFVMMNPPELEQALNEVKNLNKKEKDDALNYLQYLMDINDLYDVALGTYDFDLVLMVAQKSQKDPKEYLPFLNSLRKMELNYQRFNIDCYLNKPEKALENIFKCGNQHFEKCLQHVKSFNLYRQALNLFTPTSENYSEVCIAYAEYLSGLNKFDEAGIWFRRGGDLQIAAQAFERCLNWKEVFCVVRELKCEESEIKKLSLRLVDRLINERRFSEAAFIQENYLRNFEECIRSLIDGHLWESALEAIYRHDKKELIQSHLEKSVKNYCKLLIDNISQLQSNFEKYTTRLNIVREEKKKKLLMAANNLETDDTLSEMGMSTTTGASESTWMTNTSRQTAKNRRKHEKKKFSLKEGSVFEEGALVEALSQIVMEVDKIKDDCRELLKMLLWFGFTDDGKLLQSRMEAILNAVKRKWNFIWINEPTTKPVTGPDSTSNSIVAAMQGNNNQLPQQIEIQHAPKFKDNGEWKIDLFS